MICLLDCYTDLGYLALLLDLYTVCFFLQYKFVFVKEQGCSGWDGIPEVVRFELISSSSNNNIYSIVHSLSVCWMQEAMVVWEEFGLNKDYVFRGVLDGHSPFGYLVAKGVRDSPPSKLYSH